METVSILKHWIQYELPHECFNVTSKTHCVWNITLADSWKSKPFLHKIMHQEKAASAAVTKTYTLNPFTWTLGPDPKP